MLRAGPLTALLIVWTGAASAAEPEWAFFIPSADSAKLIAPHASDTRPWVAPGSNRSYTIAELEDNLAPPDWYPNEHPPMPGIVARGLPPQGNKPALLPCALCHLPNGAGHVESASLAGLPADYIELQFASWRAGTRKIGAGDMNARRFLIALKRGYSIDQIRSAARYFASLKPRPWIRIVETETVPASAVDSETLMRLPIPGGRMEPIGRRIVELPENSLALIYRDSHSGFAAFVPRGSVAAGRTLVEMNGASGLPPCATCHGARLAGSVAGPPLAGRTPTYLVRQLWAFKTGERDPPQGAAMRLVAAPLTADQMLCMAAYLSSLSP